MAVIHILKDGTRVDSVEGLVIKYEDAEQVYHLLDSINKRLAKERIHRKDDQHEGHHHIRAVR